PFDKRRASIQNPEMRDRCSLQIVPVTNQ
ncbi:unnamed protein product, partial [Rotaria sp. Silwood2]